MNDEAGGTPPGVPSAGFLEDAAKYDEIVEREWCWLHETELVDVRDRLRHDYAWARLETARAGRRPESQRVLDIGSGRGDFAIRVAGAGYQVVGLEVSGRALGVARERASRFPNLEFMQGTVRDAALAERHAGGFDVVLLMDVLEHVADEGECLGFCRRVLAPGGHLVVSVPSHQWLWSKLDERGGHYRRYEVRQLRQRVAESGFEMVEERSLGFPMTFLFDRLHVLMSRKKSYLPGRTTGWVYCRLEPIIFAVLQVDRLFDSTGLGIEISALCRVAPR